MQSGQVENFAIVMTTLTQSAELLKNSNRDEARQCIFNIADEINFLSATSRQKEIESQNIQKEITKMLSDLIVQQTDLWRNAEQVKVEIGKLQIDIQKNETGKKEFATHIAILKGRLSDFEGAYREHKAKLDELNDNSVGSIFRSIFCLGLDRAIMGITTLVNDDIGRMRALGAEIQRYENALQDGNVNIGHIEQLLAQAKAKQASSERFILELKEKEADLKKQEKTFRNKIAYFTNIALFYGRLLLLSQQIDHRLDDVNDIVEELNNNTPTIVSFEGSGETLLSLKQALASFDAFLANEPVLDAFQGCADACSVAQAAE